MPGKGRILADIAAYRRDIPEERKAREKAKEKQDAKKAEEIRKAKEIEDAKKAGGKLHKVRTKEQTETREKNLARQEATREANRKMENERRLTYRQQDIALLNKSLKNADKRRLENRLKFLQDAYVRAVPRQPERYSSEHTYIPVPEILQFYINRKQMELYRYDNLKEQLKTKLELGIINPDKYTDDLNKLEEEHEKFMNSGFNDINSADEINITPYAQQVQAEIKGSPRMSEYLQGVGTFVPPVSRLPGAHLQLGTPADVFQRMMRRSDVPSALPASASSSATNLLHYDIRKADDVISGITQALKNQEDFAKEKNVFGAKKQMSAKKKMSAEEQELAQKEEIQNQSALGYLSRLEPRLRSTWQGRVEVSEKPFQEYMSYRNLVKR